MNVIISSILEHYCLLPSDPINGHKNCSESQNAIFCTLSCEDGFSFAYQSLDDYFCPYNNTSIFGHTDELEYPETRIDNERITGKLHHFQLDFVKPCRNYTMYGVKLLMYSYALNFIRPYDGSQYRSRAKLSLE